VVGRLLDARHNNYFVGAGAYVVATLAVHLRLPKPRADQVGSVR
jgi:hypothetical protein